MIFLLIASSFFLGGIFKEWINERPLDKWEQIGFVLHPLAIIAILIRHHHQ